MIHRYAHPLRSTQESIGLLSSSVIDVHPLVPSPPGSPAGYVYGVGQVGGGGQRRYLSGADQLAVLLHHASGEILHGSRLLDQRLQGEEVGRVREPPFQQYP